MKETRFTYKGKEVVVQDDHPNGVVLVDKRKFNVSHHHMGGLPMWMCDEAYFGSPDVMELARHFVDYGYLFDAPGRIVVPGGHGDGGHRTASPGSHGAGSAGHASAPAAETPRARRTRRGR